MANTKISALSSATTPLAGTEVVPLVQSSTTKNVTVNNLTAGKAVPMLSMTPGTPNAIGINVTPSNWLSSYKALEFSYGAIEGAGSWLALLNNGYRNTSGSWVYKNNGAANLLALDSGAYYFYNAASGTAGNTFSNSTIGYIASGGISTSTTVDAFSRGYTKIISVNGSSGSSAIQINAAAGNGAYFDMGVNGTRSVGMYADTTSPEVFTVGALPLYLSTNGNYRVVIESGGDFRPASNNAINLGNSTARWKEVFAINGTINTSDARLKTAVSPMSDAEIAAAQELAQEIGTFQWLDSVAVKGADKARHHTGMTVQRAMEIMRKHGLEPTSYAFICHDTWEEDAKEIEDENGDIVKEFTVPKTEEKVTVVQEVKVIDGKAVLQNVERKEIAEMFTVMPVFDEQGNPVMVDVPASENEDGTITPASQYQMTHSEPVMETITKRYKKIVMNPAGDCYAFRMDQLLAFIIRGLLTPTN